MKIIFISATLLAAGASIAATPLNGWYTSLFGGYADIPPNVSITDFGFTRNHANYSSGYNAGGRLGYQSNPLRYELELTYLNADLKRFDINTIAQTGVTGDTNAGFGMANVYYDFPEVAYAISPFLGIGIGYGWVEGLLKSTGPEGETRFKDSDSVFGYQATAGLTYNFAENYAASLAYRYIGTDRVDALGKIFQANLATLSIIYRFDESNYK